MASKLAHFIAELKRRKVFRVAVLYGVVGIGVIEGAQLLFDAFGIARVAWQLVVFLIVLGFPVALVLAWAYEVRPERAGESSQGATGPDPASPDAAGAESALRDGAGVGIPALHTSAQDRKSIAVLPFANRSGLAEDLHFTDGIHDQIISQLHKVGSLSVRGRTSVEVYRESPKNLKVIGQELNARYLMEGGVQRAGERVRIIVQLIDALRDEHLWAEEYDRTLTTENLFDVQSEIALGVVSELEAALTPSEKARIEAKPTEKMDALEAYLRGRQQMSRQTTEGILRAVQEFEKAIAADPHYAQGHAALANAYLRSANLHEALTPSESQAHLTLAKESAERALELDATVSEAHVVLAIRALQWYWEWEGARDGLLRAMKLNPSDALAHAYYAIYLAYRERRFEEAQEIARAARELDPFDPFIASYWIWTLWAGEAYGRALEEARKVADLWPEKPFPHYWMGIGLLWTGATSEAIGQFESAIRSGGRMTFFVSLLGGAHALAGHGEEARKLLAELEERAKAGASVGRWIASIHAALGEGDEAIRWLNRAVDERDPAVFHVMTDRFFEGYWEDPRFVDVMRRIGLDPKKSAVGTEGGPGSCLEP
ncbi:MAG: hypothetical protein PVJ76_12790 [Gemmatimonadota bacterium]